MPKFNNPANFFLDVLSTIDISEGSQELESESKQLYENLVLKKKPEENF